MLTVSRRPEDREWDDFVATVPWGDHLHTSLWAQVKTVTGWHASRIMVRRGGDIIAGAQLRIRPLPGFGSIGYVPRGPLFREEEPDVLVAVMDALNREARLQHVHYLVVQPPPNSRSIARHLIDSGFKVSPIQVGTMATTRIDLTQSLDAIWAHIHKHTRRNIRRGHREGITVREGSGSDLATLHHLLVASSRRCGFQPYPWEALQKLWEVFVPHGYVKLFLAEYDGEPVSAHLTIPFGDTLLSKLSGWSGRHGSRKPNETLEWGVIEWAKSQGHHYYDLDGIDPHVARYVMNGEPLPDSLKQSGSGHKIGFGGPAVLFPQAYDYVYNPFLRAVYRTVFPRMAELPRVADLVTHLR